VAIGVGVTLASLLFMMRMSEAVEVESGAQSDSELDDEDQSQRDLLPKGVEVFRIHGPFFFGVAGELLDTLRRVGQSPRAIILRMRLVPYLDASGVRTVEEFLAQARIAGTKVILSGVQPQPASMLTRVSLGPDSEEIQYAASYDDALHLASQAIAAA
jgi:SulP family sulfate permease